MPEDRTPVLKLKGINSRPILKQYTINNGNLNTLNNLNNMYNNGISDTSIPIVEEDQDQDQNLIKSISNIDYKFRCFEKKEFIYTSK